MDDHGLQKKKKEPIASPSSAPQLPSIVLPLKVPQYRHSVSCSQVLVNLAWLLAGSIVPVMVKSPFQSSPLPSIFPPSVLKVSKCISQSISFCLQDPFQPCLGMTWVNFHPPLQQSSSSPQLPSSTFCYFFPWKKSDLFSCSKVRLNFMLPF